MSAGGLERIAGFLRRKCFRLQPSNTVNTATKKLLNEAEKAWTKTEAGLSNRDVPVVTLYNLRKKRIKELNDKNLKLHQEKEQNAPDI